MLKKFLDWTHGLSAVSQCIIACAAALPILGGAVATVYHLRGRAPEAKVHYDTGVRQFEARDFEAAKASFDLSLAAASDDGSARLYRARSLASLERYGDALEDVLAIEKSDPTSDGAFVLGGYIYFALRDYGRSEAQLSQALSLSPMNKLALFTRGQSLAYQHRYDAASDDLEKVLAIDPGSRKARFLLTGVYSRAGKTEKAVDNCHMLVRLDRRDPDYPELCGLVEHRAGNFENAVAYYRSAQKLDPKLPSIQENIDRALNHEGPVGSSEVGTDGA